MHRWEALNDRQITLLGRIAADEDQCAQDPIMRRSTYALRDRGLVTISRRRGEFQTRVTDAGQFYLEHGHHPEHPTLGVSSADQPTASAVTGTAKSRVSKTPSTTSVSKRTTSHKKPPTPYSERPIPVARRSKATKLVERLVIEHHVVISNPDEDEITEWRRVIDFAKRHGLAPPGKRIEKQRLWNAGRDLQISLVDGPHANSGRRSQEENPRVPVPVQLRSPHSVVAALRDSERRLLMPPALRRRALLLLQALAAEAERRGYKVHPQSVPERDHRSAHYYNGRYFPASCREGALEIVIDGFCSTVTIKQEFPQSNDPDRSQQLALDIGYSRSKRKHHWGDRKRSKLQDILGIALQELEIRAVEEQQRRLDEERAREERRIRWTAAMDTAREKASEARFATVLREQVKQWQEAHALRQYCDALEHRLDVATEDNPDIQSARAWLRWARSYAESLDPLTQPPTMPTELKFEPEDLKPYLAGWSPYGPEAHQAAWGRF
ncbi:hypothetical protein ACJ6WE_25690 [Streptomyces sp. MMS24-I31]|uniref:hypothetical protein n=1 Tax=Streptomyces sp. MMS24-I31 TaxID=3351563 RepID=UPI0038968FB0